MEQALDELNIEPHNIAMISGIGCSGRFSHYFNTYSLHGTHGRALPTAIGTKIARPDLTVLTIGGDGDGLGIGGGHIPHAAKKNVDLTYLLIDNEIYGLTKGQASPSTPFGTTTKTSPYGVAEKPLDAIPIFLAYDISFVARVASFQLRETKEVLKNAINHRGMSLVYITSSCKTFPVFSMDELKKSIAMLPEKHDRMDKIAAMKMAYSRSPIYMGIFYQIDKPGIDDSLNMQIENFKNENPHSQNPNNILHAILQYF
jgi:2-oxoglutarate ferredoxin oxidoreductase subunit beta